MGWREGQVVQSSPDTITIFPQVFHTAETKREDWPGEDSAELVYSQVPLWLGGRILMFSK